MTNGTYSILIEDKKKASTRELFFQSLAEAAQHLQNLHVTAKNKGYAIGRDYALTLYKSTIAWER